MMEGKHYPHGREGLIPENINQKPQVRGNGKFAEH